jgi:ParB family chromosome partitioning protein
MAKEAERLLADTGWLPEPLRLVDPSDGQSIEPDTEADAEGDAALPAFLSEDGDEEPTRSRTRTP